MIWSEFTQLTGAVLLIIGALMPIVNPLGDAPIFLSMTTGCDAATRAYLARRIALYSFALLVGSMLLGTFVLRIFDLSIPVVQVAGGAIVCGLGWKLLSDKPKPSEVTVDPDRAKQIALGRAFYPLTLPMSIDAGVISVAITLGANHADTLARAIIGLLSALIGAAIISLTILFIYRYADNVGRRIGHSGMMVILRLSAFITLCIGVSIAWDGIKSLLAQAGIPG